MAARFFIPGFLMFSKLAVSQLGVSSIDSFNVNMLNQIPVNLSRLGIARIELKEGVVLFNCTITEVKMNNIIYKKRGTLHDQQPGKIRKIEFEDQPWMLGFDEYSRGYLKPSFR